jgi:hypothetical protein
LTRRIVKVPGTFDQKQKKCQAKAWLYLASRLIEFFFTIKSHFHFGGNLPFLSRMHGFASLDHSRFALYTIVSIKSTNPSRRLHELTISVKLIVFSSKTFSPDGL